jgi:hypothetical protein
MMRVGDTTYFHGAHVKDLSWGGGMTICLHRHMAEVTVESKIHFGHLSNIDK